MGALSQNGLLGEPLAPGQYQVPTMAITLNSTELLMAHDAMGAFLMNKNDAKYVKSSVSFLPSNNGHFLIGPFAQWGSCAANPFH